MKLYEISWCLISSLVTPKAFTSLPKCFGTFLRTLICLWFLMLIVFMISYGFLVFLQVSTTAVRITLQASSHNNSRPRFTIISLSDFVQRRNPTSVMMIFYVDSTSSSDFEIWRQHLAQIYVRSYNSWCNQLLEFICSEILLCQTSSFMNIMS